MCVARWLYRYASTDSVQRPFRYPQKPNYSREVSLMAAASAGLPTGALALTTESNRARWLS